MFFGGLEPPRAVCGPLLLVVFGLLDPLLWVCNPSQHLVVGCKYSKLGSGQSLDGRSGFRGSLGGERALTDLLWDVLDIPGDSGEELLHRCLRCDRAGRWRSVDGAPIICGGGGIGSV